MTKALNNKVFRPIQAVFIIGLCCFASVINSSPVFAKDPLDGPYRPSPLLAAQAPVHRIDAVRIFPHDPQAFTQGLFIHGGYLYESSGLYRQSALYKKDIKTGKTLLEVRLASRFFGEGCAALGGKIYQLTWKEQTGFIYDLKTLREIGRFSYAGEGWGLTTDGKHLIMSNGSSTLTVHDPRSFSFLRKINVRDGNRPIDALNELEFIKGEIWANVFMQNVIVRISPKTGRVMGWLNVTPLYKHLGGHRNLDVLNGIAYDAKADRIFVTGKLWPAVFEIKRP